MKNNNIFNINDEAGFLKSLPYIYTKESRWFIAHWTTEDKAKASTPTGYACNLYTTTKQIPTY